ncbi:MAG: gametolysin, partial [Lactobacillus iners]|nr:gametolysin [Lactobacillus iners]
YLPHGSRWKIFKKRYINGGVYYNLGGSQWVGGKYIIIE